jgi:flagellar biosynthetic protein FlhB
MPDTGYEKTQEPTPHRRQKAREEGSVAKSQDLGSAVVLIAGIAALLVCGQALVNFVAGYGEQQLGGSPWLSADQAPAVAHFYGVLLELAQCLLPIFGTLWVAGVLVHLVQGGLHFLPDQVAMDLSRIDPLAALRRIFSLTSLVRLVFGLFKIGVIGAVAFLCFYNELASIFSLTGQGVGEIAAYLGTTLLWIALKIGIALLVLAVLDYGFQFWRHERDLRMTPQEVREEMRHLEGDPQIIARRRAVQRQLVTSRLTQAVPKADVVVTNPTELAVAIQYEPGTMAAPIVVAKGAGLLAERIRQIALQHGIPIVEKKPLAQALYREVEVNHPIPQDKYAAVAEVLAYVYHLKGKKINPAA